MTQKEKQLLLKELCMRIPYRTFVCLNPGAYNKPETCILTGIHGEKVHLNVDSDPFRIDHIKPYLRPMSSMTEEEKAFLDATKETEYTQTGLTGDGILTLESYDYLNSIHVDYHGLIPMGLALEAPEDMYKTVEYE